MTTEHWIYAGLGLLAIVLIVRATKKESPFAIPESQMQTRPAALNRTDLKSDN